MTRIAQEQPARPTWIGDRIHAVITRLDRDYHLDLATIWPHLWLAMPETHPDRDHRSPGVADPSRHARRMGLALPGCRGLVVARPAHRRGDRGNRLAASTHRHLIPLTTGWPRSP